MKAVSLEAYSVEIRNKRDSKTLRLDLFDGKNSALLEFHKDLSGISSRFFDSVIDQKCIAIDKLANNRSGVNGIALIGEYGYAGRLVDVKSSKTTYNRQKNDAPVEPFFFEIYAGRHARKGILICAKHGQSGCKIVLERFLRQTFETRNPTYIIDVKSLMPKQAIDALVKRGRLSAVRFVQNVIPSDIADRFNGRQKNLEGEVEVVIRPKKGGYLNPKRILEIYNNKRKVGDLIQVQSFEPDNMKVELDIDGRKRVLDFGNLSKVRASFDVTAEIEFDLDGYPNFESMRSASEKLINSLAKSL